MNDFVTIKIANKNNPPLTLMDILLLLPENSLLWTIMDYYGMGRPPDSLTMDQFEALVKSRATGYLMSWIELKNFASGLEQTFDCLVVGAPTIDYFTQDKTSKENFTNCDYVIEAFDSVEWSIWAKDHKVRQELTRISSQTNVR